MRTACVSAAEEIARMRELVDVMMDITRTNSNPKEIHKTEVDLGRMLRDFCEIMQPAIEEKNLEFHLDLEDRPLMVMADKTKLQRAVSNLLENALKFTSQGWIGVSAKQLPGFIQVQVSDTGCGIPEADQKRVFERFFQGDASRNLPGNGLGLALVQAVVKAHGWQISLHSVPGKGTEFTISIPDPEPGAETQG
ncbi:Sensor histidine kinase ResE [bioreactor metagenome]|uniref:histidine kinase n=1 Tax=bioreactor metagenome TaxID=1076179 RepID=A0A645H0S2_9ZZZZ